MDLAPPARPDPGRFFPQTGHTVAAPFLAFFEHYGPTLCGMPIGDAIVENGVRTQYFQRLALEDAGEGRVRLKPLGEVCLELRRRLAVQRADPLARPPVIDLAATLTRHATRAYPTRSLSDVRYLVLHHTGAPREVGVAAIAEEHVRVNEWPGIGYHFVIDADGTIFQTQDLTTVSYHARQFNPVAVGIALCGDLATALPTAEQLEATADLAASLLADLGLPEQNLRGHREMVRTACPGDTFLSVWKPRLQKAVAARLGGEPGAPLFPAPQAIEAPAPGVPPVAPPPPPARHVFPGPPATIEPGAATDPVPPSPLPLSEPEPEPPNPPPSPGPMPGPEPSSPPPSPERAPVAPDPLTDPWRPSPEAAPEVPHPLPSPASLSGSEPPRPLASPPSDTPET